MKFAIIYYSKTGHTREMAEVIARGLAAAGGETRFFSVEEAMDADRIDRFTMCQNCRIPIQTVLFRRSLFERYLNV